jgi:hypothetical protein
MAEKNSKLFNFYGSFIAKAEEVKARENKEIVKRLKSLKWDRYRYISEVSEKEKVKTKNAKIKIKRFQLKCISEHDRMFVVLKCFGDRK